MRYLAARRHALDVLAGVAFLVVGSVEVMTSSLREGPVWANLAAVAVVAGAAYLRRRAPLRAAAAFAAAVLVEGAFLTPPPELTHPFVGLLFFAYAAGAYSRTARSVLVVPAFAVAIGAVNLLTDEPTLVADVLFLVTVQVAAVGVRGWRPAVSRGRVRRGG